jgi:two-component system NtrC family sensor kinase
VSVIEEKAALLDLLFEATLDGIVDWDVRNDCATYNERWRFLLGYDNDELNPTPTTWREFVHPQEREALEQALSDHLHESWPFSQSVRMRHRATGWRWISIQGASRRGQDGEVERMALVFADIEERVHAEGQVRALVEAIPDTILRVATDGNLLGVKQGKLISGPPASRREAKGNVLGAIQDPDIRKQLLEAVALATSRNEVVLIPCHRTSPEGEAIYNEIRVVRGGEDEAICIVRDVTREKVAEEHLSRGQKLEAIGQLAAGLAHEINTPMQYIGDNLHFAKEVLPDLLGLLDAFHSAIRDNMTTVIPAKVVELLAERAEAIDLTYLRETLPTVFSSALEGVAQVSKIVGAMKTLEHVGNQARAPTNLNALLENTVVVATNAWTDVAELSLQLAPTLPLVDCVAGEIAQVVLNLVVNAAQAIRDKVGTSGKKGALTIATSLQGQDVELRVSDDGVGIAEAIRERVFDPFFTTRPVGQGTGQGLAQVHAAVVKLHGGTVRFDSQQGRGTTFVVRLPVQRRTVASAEKTANSSSDSDTSSDYERGRVG